MQRHHFKFIRRAAIASAAMALALPAMAQITFYRDSDYRGQVFKTSRPLQDFRSAGFNDMASSVVVEGGRWEVCDNAGYGGNCVVLRPGNYPSLAAMGLNDRVSSTRPADARRADVRDAPPPPPEPPYAWRRRPQEQIFEARVSSVRAVVGAPTERCWVEREEAQREAPSAGRGVLGAVIGGVIGHQIGGGTGRDLATVGGAVAGAAIGANTGRGTTGGRDVRRCETVPSAAPTYWDVGYEFRGVHHQVQMQAEPGRTISVNKAGEPRV
jgi:uncharacterized protein YcfJ